jgi:hypothetical protein
MTHSPGLLVLLTALCCAPAPLQASAERLIALGGDPRLLLDDGNVFVYPATSLEWPRLEVALFADWAGVLYPLSSGQALGLFFNRPTPQLERFSAYLTQEGSAALQELEPRPWVDVLYGLRLRPHLHLGLSGLFAYDKRALADRKASASSADLRLGLRLGRPGNGLLDLTLGLLRRRLADTSFGRERRQQTSGQGYLLEVRGRWPLNRNLSLLPALSLESDAYALSPDRREQRFLYLGLGLNASPAPGVLAIAGLHARHERTQWRLPAQPLQEESLLLVPIWVVAGEAQVGSLLFRLGLRHENQLVRRAGPRVESQDFDAVLKTHLGLGLEFGPLLLDGLLERDFLRDGPHFIGGSRHGGGILSRLSLTYRFTPPPTAAD